MLVDLDAVGPGLADPVFDSQRIFRALLEALSRPGTIVRVPGAAGPLPRVQPAAAALLLALLDQDTRLWLSPAYGDAIAAASLRFHTGCVLVASPGEADFALVADPQELPPLETFPNGTDEHPERSASVVLQVPALAQRRGWRLSGPGVRGEAHLAVGGLDAGFVAEWDANRRRFPRGVDLYLACGESLCGLPRGTLIEG